MLPTMSDQKDLETGYETDSDTARPVETSPLLAFPGGKKRAPKKCFVTRLRQKKQLEKFYREQRELLDVFEADAKLVEKISSKEQQLQSATSCTSLNLTKEAQSELRKDQFLAQMTFGVNVLLLIAKIVVAYLSKSLSVISSVVDSAVDVTSGIVIWSTTRAIEKHDPYEYPRGRSKLEPLSVIIVSVIMAVASLQMIIQSIQSIVEHNVSPNVQLSSILIMVVVILVKIALFVVCWRRKTPSGQVLAVDHRNDCVSNVVAIVCAYIADKTWVYIDPIGAILVSLYIIVTWFLTGREQVPLLSGKTAHKQYVSRIIRLCLDHDERIMQLERLYVYHYGSNLLIEVHIVLPQNMHLKETHDLSEMLQRNLEHLPYVERAFVHCDYSLDTCTCICGAKH